MRAFGRYEGRSVLSKGSTPLLLCHDRLNGRDVVIRTLCHTLALDAEHRSRFLDSAMVLARLSSPYVASVTDMGYDQGDPYVVMQLPEGGSLRAAMDEPRPRGLSFAIDVISQLCDALADVHSHGVVQLGLRPPGIFVAEGGQVTVVPFGVIPIHGTHGTLAALNLDEIAYLAPELVEGRIADRRADIFSLGAIAFELVARHRPFRARTIPDMLLALVGDQAAFDPADTALLDPGLQRVILKSLSRDPSDRYSEAGLMLVDLAELTCSTPVDDSPEAQGSPAPQTSDLDAELEGLRATALACVAEGHFKTAEALTEEIEREAPGDPRNVLLRAYLREERAVEDLLTTARLQTAADRPRDALATVDEVLELDPWRASARTLHRELERQLARAKAASPSPSTVSGEGRQLAVSRAARQQRGGA